MKIDGIDIRKYNAKQLSVEFQPPSDKIKTEWIDGAATPQEYKTYIKYGKMNLSILVRGNDRNEIMHTISNIMLLLTKTVSLTLDGYKGTYDGSLTSSSVAKTSVKTRYILKLKFDGYLKDAEIVHEYTDTTAAAFETIGTRETPCIIEITPTVNLQSFVITGFGDDITVSGLKKDKTIIIDGARGTATIDGANAFGNVDLWAFPSLSAGAKTMLTFSSNKCVVKIRYNPMWL